MKVAPPSLDRLSLERAAKELARRDDALAEVLRRLGPPPLWKRPATLATLIRIILEQQVSLASAKVTFDRLNDLCGRRITANAVREHGEQGLRRIGITRQKSRYIVALANEVADGNFRVGALRHQSDDELRQRITSLLGLGDWSADVFLLMALCRPDILPTGDLALVKGMEELDRHPYASKTEIINRAEKWRPFRSVATRMIWQLYLDNRGQKVP